jgi:hypothetical protein
MLELIGLSTYLPHRVVASSKDKYELRFYNVEKSVLNTMQCVTRHPNFHIIEKRKRSEPLFYALRSLYLPHCIPYLHFLSVSSFDGKQFHYCKRPLSSTLHSKRWQIRQVRDFPTHHGFQREEGLGSSLDQRILLAFFLVSRATYAPT